MLLTEVTQPACFSCRCLFASLKYSHKAVNEMKMALRCCVPSARLHKQRQRVAGGEALQPQCSCFSSPVSRVIVHASQGCELIRN